MTGEDYDAFCRSLPATSRVVQWGGALVWKGGDKVFAIGWFSGDEEPKVTFKVDPLAFEMLKELPGLRPAPYLASRGMSWIEHFGRPGLSDEELRAYLTRSHALVAAGLTKKARRELGLGDA